MHRRAPARAPLLALLTCALARAAAPSKDAAALAEGRFVGQLAAGGPDLRLAVTRLAADRVRVASDGPGFPAVEIPLRTEGDDLVQASGSATFRLLRGARPVRLEVRAPDGVQFAGRRLDLGDEARGIYPGEILYDPRGPAKTGVTLTVTRVDVDTVRITSDDARLPSVDVPLRSEGTRIVSAGGDSSLVLDRTSRPARLQVTFRKQARWSGTRRSLAAGGGH